MRLAVSAIALLVGCATSFAHAADVAAGKAIFDTTCKNCHSLRVGVNEVGPSLWHVVGRPSAVVPGFQYSPALKDFHKDWTKDELNAYLQQPRADIHGAQMFFRGLPAENDRANVIAFLESQQ